MTIEELRQLATQLSQPHGSFGHAVAEMMNETNIRMTRDAIARLQLSGYERILELGHGNAAHLAYILEQAPGVHYTGLELSELMYTEAQRINRPLLHRADFFLYEGKTFPFTGDAFDKAFSVNTIYFWPDPLHTLAEFYRVLKPGATLCITYADEAFMKQLPFTAFGFTLYNHHTMTDLFSKTPFHSSDLQSRTELIKSNTGELVEREFTTITVKK